MDENERRGGAADRQGVRDDGALRFAVAAGEAPRIKVTMLNGPLRVLGDAETDEVIVRAVKPNGETVPAELVAEVQSRLSGEITIKARPAGDIQRQARKITKSFEGRHGDFFDNIGSMTNSLGEMLETLTTMKTIGNNLDRVRLEVIVPRRSDVALTTVTGAIQAGRIDGSVAIQSASGQIDCARIGGKLAVKSVSGNLRLGDISGTISVQTASGDVTTRGIDGDLVIQTMSGEAQGHDLTGQVGFKSHSGSLLVRQSNLNGFYLNTTSGECLVEAALGAGEYEVRTVSGDITLRPQPDLSAILSGRTVSGGFSCNLPHRHADEDWQAEIDEALDDEFGGDRGFTMPEIDLPGLQIGKGGIDVGGFLKIDDEGTVQMPGMRIGRQHFGHDFGHEKRRERRRGRNRWEYLLGDPASAASGETRLRVRTVSGSLSIRPGRDDTNAASAPRETARPAKQAAPARPAEREPARARRDWPDSELWPTAETGPTPPSASAAPSPPAPPTPPTPPVAPTAPVAPPTPVSPVAPEATLATPPAVPDSLSGTDADTADDAPTPAAALPTDAEQGADTAPMTTDAATDTADSASADESAAPDGSDRERTRLEILEALRGGEITTDEALLLLRQLDA